LMYEDVMLGPARAPCPDRQPGTCDESFQNGTAQVPWSRSCARMLKSACHMIDSHKHIVARRKTAAPGIWRPAARRLPASSSTYAQSRWCGRAGVYTLSLCFLRLVGAPTSDAAAPGTPSLLDRKRPLIFLDRFLAAHTTMSSAKPSDRPSCSSCSSPQVWGNLRHWRHSMILRPD
jgi:hypothetical protein